MEDEEALAADEVHLREVLAILLRSWKWVLLATAVGLGLALGVSALQTPLYEASAVIAIDQAGTPLTTKPANWLVSEQIRSRVMEQLGLDDATLPAVTVRPDTADPTILRITVQNASPDLAALVANTWAEVGIEWFEERALTREAVETTWAVLDNAEATLQALLEEQQLTGLSRTSLCMITGVGECPALVAPEPGDLPVLTAAERLRLTSFMLQVEAARVAYNRAYNALADAQRAFVTHPPMIVKKAEPPPTPLRPKMALNGAVGGGMGLMLGIFFVLFAHWRRSPEAGGLQLADRPRPRQQNRPPAMRENQE